MSQRQRLVYYLLLNIFVSACVTGAILFWYDRTYRQAVILVAPVAPAGSAEPLLAATLNPETDVPIEIVSVIGAGTLSAETALLRYNGEGELDLTGWRLQDEDGNTYTFPQLKLYPSGAVQVHTTAGTDTVVDLYWGLRQSVWQSGEQAALLDPQGNPRALYRVP
ncbi:MAG: lamin tail domain-containing protein [Chloroflexi bacterium]|nr:lamin tail domain-containing protein [Chloroflexota bacterium]